MDPFEVLVTEDLTGKNVKELERVFLSKEDGRILFLGRIPVANLYATFLAGIYDELGRMVGSAVRGLILNSAKNRGRVAGKAIRRRYERKFGKMDDGKAMSIVKNMITIWERCFGWGKCEFDDEEGFTVRVKDSFEAVGYLKLKKGYAKHGVCWMFLGYIWGLLEGLLERRVEGEETTCIAMGNDVCTFRFRF